jgi:hypothetical protein
VRFRFLPGALGSIVLALALPAAASAQSALVTVPGDADIFAAGQAAPPALPGATGASGGGTLPPQANVTVAGGDILTVSSVSGSVWCDASMYPTVSANGPCGGISSGTVLKAIGPMSGIVDTDSNDFLAGVFVGPATPSAPPPARLDFSVTALGADYTSLAPQVDQVFFIGSGITTTGVLHRIAVPRGATRLFLGIADGNNFHDPAGYYDDDGGAYQATVNIAPPSGETSPAVVPHNARVLGSDRASVSATISPNGLPTTAHFQYGRDRSPLLGGGVAWTHATSEAELDASDPIVTVVSTLTDLAPNAVYHVRMVASNRDGRTVGPDVMFRTAQALPPPQLGTHYNMIPISGRVFVKLPLTGPPAAADGARARLAAASGFVPLTAPRQLPKGTEVDARHGTLQLVAATAVARRTQAVTLGGAVFSIKQMKTGPDTGLTTLSLVEGAFAGGPSYAACRRGAGDGASARSAAASPKVLQTLRARDRHGRFRTRGRFSAATVRGTAWTTTDRCDGTLTTVQSGTVSVRDTRTGATTILHAGQSHLARP